MRKKIFDILIIFSLLFIMSYTNFVQTTPAITNSTSPSGDIWIDYYNHTVLTDGGVISANASLIAFSEHPVQMGFIFVNNTSGKGTTNVTLKDWTVYNPNPNASVAIKQKIADGGSGDYTHPFSLTLPPNLDPLEINLTIYDNYCNMDSIVYHEDTNNNQDPGFNLSINSYTPTISNYKCTPISSGGLSISTTTVTKTPSFDLFTIGIIPGVIVSKSLLFKKKK